MGLLTKRSLTSVKVPDELYSDFKTVTDMSRLNLQDLVERSMFLYIVDSNYRQTIHSTYNLYYTGSALVEELKRQKGQ
jgi:hypothetical protein